MKIWKKMLNITNASYSVFSLGPPSLAQRYEIGKIIGEGNFAVVKECTEK